MQDSIPILPLGLLILLEVLWWLGVWLIGARLYRWFKADTKASE